MFDEKICRERAEALIISMVGKKYSSIWWNGMNKAFNKTPEQQWADDYKIVYDYIMHMAGGEYS